MGDPEMGIKTRGRLTQLVVWFLFIVAFFCVSARLGTKYAMRRTLALDDVLIILSQVFYLVQCITITLAISTAFDPNSTTISGETLDLFLKFNYVSISFVIITLAFIKWSALDFVKTLSPVRLYRQIVIALSVFISLWLVAAVALNIFQCALPTPWDYINGTRCINRPAWWTFVALLNILTDLALISLYILIFRKLQIATIKKVAIIAGFCTRLIVVALSAAQLAAFYNGGEDQASVESIWLVVVLNQAVISSSAITACVPYLRPFMEGLQSGIIHVNRTSTDEEDIVRLNVLPSSNDSSWARK
ncbi:hypothetical protein F5Y16DRAFT_264660 [Xylariaceae sp. FL0255]|nr:hypothetical protein F5Y16DRAFT_264660 [Xylariaceae sp. FL0255]